MAETNIRSRRRHVDHNRSVSMNKTTNLAQDEGMSIMVLPADIMTIIFLKLLVNPLFRCGCVCKLWRDTINNSYFADKYRTSSSFGMQSQLILFRSSYYYPHAIEVYTINPQLSTNTFKLSQQPIDQFSAYSRKIENIGYGLFLVQGSQCFNKPSILYNPLRGEKLILPLVKREDTTGMDMVINLCTHGLAFNYSTRQYKLVRVTKICNYPQRHKLKLVTEVYTLGSDKWKQISAVPPHWGNNMHAGTLAYGDIHWYDCNDIVSFMVTTEEFKVTSVPDLICRWNRCLFSWKEDLALLVTSWCNMNMNMWVLRDYEKKLWEKLYTIPFDVNSISNIGTWEEDIVVTTWMMKMEHKTYRWNPSRGDITDITPLVIGNEVALHSYCINLDSLASHGIVASTRSQKENQEGA